MRRTRDFRWRVAGAKRATSVAFSRRAP